jgi:hypothetical protein
MRQGSHTNEAGGANTGITILCYRRKANTDDKDHFRCQPEIDIFLPPFVAENTISRADEHLDVTLVMIKQTCTKSRNAYNSPDTSVMDLAAKHCTLCRSWIR